MSIKKRRAIKLSLRIPVLYAAAVLLLAVTALFVVDTRTAAALPSAVTQFAQGTTPNPISPTSPTGSPPITLPTKPGDSTTCPNGDCIINDYVTPAVKALAAAVGVICVISLIIAGIQYSSAGGDPSKVGAAKARIGKTIGAFLAFIFLYEFLNYIVPGGI